MSLTARVAFLLLVAASFGAFFVAQRLKTEKPVIAKFKRDRFFSPNGDGRKDEARIRFTVREADDVTVVVVDQGNAPVKQLVEGLDAEPGRRLELAWDGTTDAGGRAPDGLYRARIDLTRQGRSVIPQLGFRLDTQAPEPAVIRTDPPIVAPGRPVTVRYRGAGPRAVPRFQVLDTDADPPRPVAAFRGDRDQREAIWDGNLASGKPAPTGAYLVAVGVRDRAGNLGWGPRLPPQPGTVEGRPGVTVRDLAIQPPVRAVQAGRFVTFRVDARRRPWHWQIRRIGEPRPRKRSNRPKTTTSLTVRAPGGVSGVYLFEVRAGRHRAAVPFAVQSADRAPLQVVLPVVSWLGTVPLDDPADGDGIPNTLLTGQPVPVPRALTGLPRGFADHVAPLLVALDRARVRYDITTDLALARSRGPRSTRAGLLFVAPSRWVPRSLARRLREYVAAGGRVGLVGTGGLRAGVQIADGRLLRPTAAGPADAFGQRLADVRSIEEAGNEGAPILTLTDDPPQLPLFTGFDGELDHDFTHAEELVEAGRGELVAGLGATVSEAQIQAAEAAGELVPEQHPALTAVKLGDGYVLRTGFAGWVPALEAGDPEVAQLTRNLADLLRRVNPRPRSVGG